VSGGRHVWLAGPRSYPTTEGGDSVALPANPGGDRGRAEYDHCVSSAERPHHPHDAGGGWLEANRSIGCPGANPAPKLRTSYGATKERYDMSTSVGIQELREVRERPLSKPLDEAVWQAWVAKGRAQDGRGRAARVKAVKWVSAAALLVAAGLWSHLTTYDVVVRFVVAAGAIMVMLNLLHARHYTFAAVFGALALLYNPVVSVFSFSGEWQRALVLASAAPFVASLAWPLARTAQND